MKTDETQEDARASEDREEPNDLDGTMFTPKGSPVEEALYRVDDEDDNE